MKLNYKIINKIKNIPFDYSHIKERGFIFKKWDEEDLLDTMIYLAYKVGLNEGKKFIIKSNKEEVKEE